MNTISRVEIPVTEETARRLGGDTRRTEAIGRLVDRMVRPSQEDDPLAAVLEATARAAQVAGLTEAEIEAELAAYSAERRS